MRKSILWRWTMMTVLLCAGQHAMAKTRVFILAGQSNMNGLGTASELKAPYDKPPAKVKIWDGKGWKDLGPGVGTNPEYFGPEIAFGHAMREAYPDDPICLIKYAAGGTALYNDWSPEGEGGPQYKQFMATVKAALGHLKEANVKYSIEGMMWMQGESDAHEGQGEAYETNLTAFIKHIRSVVKSKKLPFILARIRTHYGSPDNNAKVREAQQQVAEAMDRVAWFDTDAYKMRDPGHYNTEGQIDLGKDFAASFLAVVRVEDKKKDKGR